MSLLLADALIISLIIEFSCRHEAIVSWYMVCHLGCSHGQFILFVELFTSLIRQGLPGHKSKVAERISKFS